MIYVHLETGIFHEMGIPVIPARREIPESREIPGREKFEAIREGGNGNFPLNIPVLSCPHHHVPLGML